MFCNNCGGQNDSDARFCKKCGEPLSYMSAEDGMPGFTEEPVMQEPVTQEPVFDKSQARSPDEYFFTPARYGETHSYNGADVSAFVNESPQRAPRKRGNAPYIITSLFTALISVAFFVFPFMNWLGYTLQLFDHELGSKKTNLIEFFKRFIINDSVEKFLLGPDSNLGLSEYIPEQLASKYSLGRIGAFVISGMFALSLFLFLLFILMALFRVRAASGMGISAALINIASVVGFFMYVQRIVDYMNKLDVFSLRPITITQTPAAYASISLSVLVIILCVVFAVLDRRKKRRKY